VVDGLNEIGRLLLENNSGGERSLDKFGFLKTLMNLLDAKGIYYQVEFLSSVFESMASEEWDTLSVGEWARGLTLFFEGTQEEKEHALFQLLDEDGDGSWCKEDLKEYLKPLVKAMIPPQFLKPLFPHLLQFCADQVLSEVVGTDSFVLNSDGKLSEQEFTEWISANGVIDSIAQIIDTVVYESFLENKKLRREKDDPLFVAPVRRSVNNRNLSGIQEPSSFESAESEAKLYCIENTEDDPLFVIPAGEVSLNDVAKNPNKFVSAEIEVTFKEDDPMFATSCNVHKKFPKGSVFNSDGSRSRIFGRWQQNECW